MITWSSEPEHKAAGIALSNGDLTAERSGGTSWQAVRSTSSKSSGKWYWEVKVDVANSAHTMIGIGTSSETLTYPGDTLEGYSYYGSVGYIYHSTETLWGSSYTANDVIGIALDLDNGKIWWSKNGVWQESGDPAAGTGEAYSGITGTFFAMVGLFTDGNKSTANFGATAFRDPVPDGFESFEPVFDPGSWANKLKLTIDSSKIDTDLIDFPVLITLSSVTGITNFDTTDIFDELSTVSGTKKIAITTTISGVETELYTEIERWDWENEQAWLWTKVPTIASGIDTTLDLYYDSTHDDNTSYIGDTGETPAQNVWNSNFKSVWHLAQDPNGDVADCILDSTANTHTGTPIGSMTSDDLVDGKIGKAIDFDGINDGINFGDHDDFTFSGDFTMEWIMNTTDAGGVALINNTGNANTAGIWELEINRTAGKFSFYEGGGTRFTSLASVNDEENKYMYLVRKSNNLALYINNAYDNEVSYSTTLNGTHMYLAISYASTVPFDGILDEFRMSDSARSDAWGKASYYNNWNDLITFSEIAVIFTFTNPIPPHLSTVYGISHTLQLIVTCSGEELSYVYDAKFYDASDDSQIGSTISGVDSGQFVFTTIPTLSGGVDYSWYLWATSSGVNDTSSTYTFTNKFLCAGTVKEGETALSGIPVRLYKRDTGELIGSDISTGISGTFEIVTDYNEYHYAIALYASTISGVDITETNALIYDHLRP